MIGVLLLFIEDKNQFAVSVVVYQLSTLIDTNLHKSCHGSLVCICTRKTALGGKSRDTLPRSGMLHCRRDLETDTTSRKSL